MTRQTPRRSPRPSRSRLRRLWFNIHLWLGIGLLVVFIPLGLSGAALVWSDALDAVLHPARRAPATTVRLPPSAYLASAALAGAGGDERMRPASITYPTAPDHPVVVLLRSGGGGGGRSNDPGRRRERNVPQTRAQRQGSVPQPANAGMDAPQRPRGLSVYLDPATARVLDTAALRSGPLAFLHQFHESLLIPGWGRSAVGWLGVALLVSSLTGLYLWWPRGAWLKGLAYRRTPLTTLNLHYTAGFWIALPLAALALTGVGLGFPRTTRALIGQFAPVASTQGGPRGDVGGGMGGGGPRGQAPLARTELDADVAMTRSGASPPTLASLNAPTRARPAWRIESRSGPAVAVDDATGAVSPAPAPASGDAAYRWIRRIHAGQDLPLAWRVIITLGGLAPTLLGVTGLIAWVSRSLRRKAIRG